MTALLDFKVFFDASPNAAMVLDRDLCFVAANAAYLRVVGVDDFETLRGRKIFDAFPNDPDDPDNLSLQMLRTSLQRVVREGVVDHVPLIAYVVNDGAPRYWSSTHTPIFGDDGRVAWVLQLPVDVTQLTEAERDSSRAVLSAGVMARAQTTTERNTVLTAERERLLLLLDQAPAFIAVLRGKNHVFELVNEAYRKVVNHRDVIGRTVAESIPEVVAQGFVGILDGVAATGKPFIARAIDVQLQHSPGGALSTVCLDINFQPIIEFDGHISGIFVHGTDLTEKRDLQRHYEELSTIVSQSHKSMAIAGNDGLIKYINDAGRVRHGVGDMLLPGSLHARDLIADVDRHLYDEVIEPTLKSVGQWMGELQLVAKNGTSYVADHNAFVLRNRDGAVIGTASISRDLSVEKAIARERDVLAAREQLATQLAVVRDRERRFFAESIPQQVWTALPDSGLLDFINHRTVEYFGREIADLLGEGWLDFLHKDDLDSAGCAWAASLRSGAPYETTFRLRRHDGAWRWYLARAVPFRDEHGVIVKWFGTNTDIHDATQANEELQRRTEFEQQLIGIVSHDLRNPLNAIALSAAALDSPGAEALDERRRAAVSRITSSSNRAARMISDLLDFSQARFAGEIPVYPEKASLRALAAAVVDELAIAWPTRRIEVCHDGEEIVVVDSDRIGQVIGNLVGNALQHSASDCVVTLRTAVEGEVAVVDVGNAGVIDVADLPRLFAPYQQGPKASSKAGRSVGLGLYIAAQLVEAHHGTIEVHSTVDDGTRFVVRLPRQPG